MLQSESDPVHIGMNIGSSPRSARGIIPGDYTNAQPARK